MRDNGVVCIKEEYKYATETIYSDSGESKYLNNHAAERIKSTRAFVGLNIFQVVVKYGGCIINGGGYAVAF